MKIHDAYLFIDWDTARRFRWISSPLRQGRLVRAKPEQQLDEIYRMCAWTLKSLTKDRFRCQPRIYHGWHRGSTPTDDFRMLHGLQNSKSAHESTIFGQPLLSHELVCGTEFGSIRDTLRAREESPQEEQQKMVDTALAADLLFVARSATSRPGTRLLVLSEDDDMLPPVIIANHWGVDCHILRTRPYNRHMPRHKRYIVLPQPPARDGEDDEIDT